MTITTELAQRMRNYLDTAVNSGVKLLHLTTDELGALLDALAAKDKQIAEQDARLISYAQIATDNARAAHELEARTEQQPVAWLVRGGRLYRDRPHISIDSAETAAKKRDDGSVVVPLYAAPPAQPVTVKLPDGCEHDVMAPVASFMYEDGYEFDGDDYTAVVGRMRCELETVLRRTLTAAGIKIAEGE